jgi:hypothetical protein
MNPVAHPGTNPRIQRLRAAAPLGWLGLALWVWATVALPALHAAQHAREADRPAAQRSHRQRIQTIIDEVLGRTAEVVGAHRHAHGHHHGLPGGAPHGKGSIEHLDVAFAAVAVFVVPPGFRPVEGAELVSAPTPPALAPLRRPGHPRGPPWLLFADHCPS